MTRQAIFDAVKAARGGKRWTDPDIAILDRALDNLGVPRDQAPQREPKKPPKGRLAALIGAAAATALTATLALWEGKENVGYRDIVGVPTACYGDTNDVEVGKFYTDAECQRRLEEQALAHVEPVLRCTPSLKGHDSQLVAAGSLAYNIGANAYCNSTVDRRFDAGDWRGACDAFLMWRFAGGKEVRGLLNRRKYERDLCLKSLPQKENDRA